MRKILLLLLAVFASLVILADPAYPDSIQVTQPNGTILWIRINGDEFYNWRSTTDGHVLLRDSLQYYRYATVVADSLVPSTMIAHNIANRTEDETQYLQANKSIVQNFVRAEIQVAQTLAKAEMEMAMMSDAETISATQSSVAPNMRIVNDCGCETKNETTYSYNVREQYIQLQYANPTTGSVLQVQVVETPVSTESYLLSSAQTYTYDNDLQAYTLELWSGTLGRLRSITTTQRQVDIDIVGIPAGWYQLLLLQEGEIIEANNVYINH